MKKEENKKNFEESYKELQSIIDKLESDISIDDAIKYYQEGMELSIYLNSLLTHYEKKIKILKDSINSGKFEDLSDENPSEKKGKTHPLEDNSDSDDAASDRIKKDGSKEKRKSKSKEEEMF